MFHSEWGYYRDTNSGNCILNHEYGPQLDCTTGYVNGMGYKLYYQIVYVHTQLRIATIEDFNCYFLFLIHVVM